MRVSSRSDTCELRYEPPRATVRRASSSSADEAFFRTNARAPLRMALTTEFSSSYIERITTFTAGQCRSSSVVASMPFMPGSPMSISTRSGAVLLAELHRVGAVLGLPHHAKLGAALQDGLHPVAHQFVIVDQNNREGHRSSSVSRHAARTVVPLPGLLVIERPTPPWAA